LGKVMADALSGRSTPQDALDRAAAAYTKAATEQGFIK
jgi:hypothetical protein